MKIRTVRGITSFEVEREVISTMIELNITMPPVVLLLGSDEAVNEAITQRTKKDDEYAQTLVEVVSGNINNHEIHLLIVGPSRGLKFSISSNNTTIFVHIQATD